MDNKILIENLTLEDLEIINKYKSNLIKILKQHEKKLIKSKDYHLNYYNEKIKTSTERLERIKQNRLKNLATKPQKIKEQKIKQPKTRIVFNRDEFYYIIHIDKLLELFKDEQLKLYNEKHYKVYISKKINILNENKNSKDKNIYDYKILLDYIKTHHRDMIMFSGAI